MQNSIRSQHSPSDGIGYIWTAEHSTNISTRSIDDPHGCVINIICEKQDLILFGKLVARRTTSMTDNL